MAKGAFFFSFFSYRGLIEGGLLGGMIFDGGADFLPTYAVSSNVNSTC